MARQASTTEKIILFVMFIAMLLFLVLYSPENRGELKDKASPVITVQQTLE